MISENVCCLLDEHYLKSEIALTLGNAAVAQLQNNNMDTHTQTPRHHYLCVCLCLCFSLLTPVQMEGLPFLFVVTNISQMSLDLCWLLTLLSPSPSPPSLHPLLPVSFSMSLCLPSCLSPFVCLSLSFTLSSLPFSWSLSSSLPPSLSFCFLPISPCVSLSLSRAEAAGVRAALCIHQQLTEL